MKRKMLLITLAIPAILSQNLQAQTSASRLTAKSDWVNNGVTFSPVDSTGYNFSGGRGGDLTHTLKYDNATTWNWVDTSTGYENFLNYIQEFDGNSNITSITYQYWSGTSWVLSTKTLYTYNSGNQLATMTQQTWGGTAFVPVSQDAYSYNAAGKLYLDVYGTWDALTSVFDQASQKTYIYNPSNTNIINETDENIAGTPAYTYKYDYTYTSTNKMQNATKSMWNGTGWVAVSMTTNSYDGFDNLTNWLFQLWDIPSGTFINDSLHIYSYASGGTMPQTDILQTWDNTGSGVWNNVMQFANTYNGANQLTSSVGTAWNVVGVFEHANGDPMAMYYYSTYVPGVSVKNVTSIGGDANIYPVPAQNMLHVDLSWNQPQTATIAIYNMQGSIVRQWDAPATTQYNSAVSLDNLAEGSYFIKINGAEGQVVKQFVIAH